MTTLAESFAVTVVATVVTTPCKDYEQCNPYSNRSYTLIQRLNPEP